MLRNPFLLVLSVLVGYCLCWDFNFETCTDGSQSFGGCTVHTQEGALGQFSGNSVELREGYLDFGEKIECPFQMEPCEWAYGFTFYGHLKLFSYPSGCNNYGVYVSSNHFNIHVLGDGRMRVYVWITDGQEWYAETLAPIPLKSFLPINLQFYYDPVTKRGRLELFVQNKLYAATVCQRQRTYRPRNGRLLFGGDGTDDHYLHAQLDKTRVFFPMWKAVDIQNDLLDPNLRKAKCVEKPYSSYDRPFHCYWYQDLPMDWDTALAKCQWYAWESGYQYGRLARFSGENEHLEWREAIQKLKLRGEGPTGYTAWIGGGKNRKWLNETRRPSDDMQVPPEVVYTESDLEGDKCMVLNTKYTPHRWEQKPCSFKTASICEMSWNCLNHNPCKNWGVCTSVSDGPFCKCLPGTSGKYCEKGKLEPLPRCANNCPCNFKQDTRCGIPHDVDGRGRIVVDPGRSGGDGDNEDSVTSSPIDGGDGGGDDVVTDRHGGATTTTSPEEKGQNRFAAGLKQLAACQRSLTNLFKQQLESRKVVYDVEWEKRHIDAFDRLFHVWFPGHHHKICSWHQHFVNPLTTQKKLLGPLLVAEFEKKRSDFFHKSYTDSKKPMDQETKDKLAECDKLKQDLAGKASFDKLSILHPPSKIDQFKKLLHGPEADFFKPEDELKHAERIFALVNEKIGCHRSLTALLKQHMHKQKVPFDLDWEKKHFTGFDGLVKKWFPDEPAKKRFDWHDMIGDKDKIQPKIFQSAAVATYEEKRSNFLLNTFKKANQTHTPEIAAKVEKCDNLNADLGNNAIFDHVSLGRPMDKVEEFKQFLRKKPQEVGEQAKAQIEEKLGNKMLHLMHESTACHHSLNALLKHSLTSNNVAHNTLWEKAQFDAFDALYNKWMPGSKNLKCSWHIVHNPKHNLADKLWHTALTLAYEKKLAEWHRSALESGGHPLNDKPNLLAKKQQCDKLSSGLSDKVSFDKLSLGHPPAQVAQFKKLLMPLSKVSRDDDEAVPEDQ